MIEGTKKTSQSVEENEKSITTKVESEGHVSYVTRTSDSISIKAEKINIA